MTTAGSHTVIVGAGAVGTVLAVRLHRAGYRVTVAGRPGSPAEPRRLRLLLEARDEQAEVPAIPVDAPSPPADAVVCVCVKAHATAAVAASGHALLRAARLIVSAQNGAGNIEQLAAVSSAPLVLASPGFGAAPDADVIRLHGVSDTPCAAVPPAGDAAARRWAEALADAGFPATVKTDWRAVLWRKLIVNAVVNPLTALHNVRNGEVAERPELRTLAAAIVDEAAGIAAREGVGLPPAAELLETVMAVCRATAPNRSSMLEDKRAGRPTELEQITGYIVNRAHHHAMPAPVNEAILRQTRGL